MDSVFHDASPVLDQQVILPALIPPQVELIDCIEIFRNMLIELGW